MPVDRERLKQALNELVRLKRRAESPKRFRAQLSISAQTAPGIERNSPSSAGDQLDTPLRNWLGRGLALP
jgi:hypothetical protein